ncbi:transcription/translation regulatory transformer protein RfaH [Ectothiorhodospira shaposhnikovii]|uniref:transcription/translation regulatory transformer protein RfaH n=1 Tax=Ectothiorhodospira shaposhnikovii TaxID=1054 RepID=UPI0019060369|nr:transcription/translation regulatory transformer protein RfaH [Ectothiorhodospira shaposhnikovii]
MGRSWYLVYCKPRQEETAARALEAQAYQVYLPKVRRKSRRTGFGRVQDEPLFPRYLFAACSQREQSLAPIRSTHGVSTLVRFGEHYQPVSDRVVIALKEQEDPVTGCHHLQEPSFMPGEKVTIIRGPLSGLEGVFQAATSADRVFILLDWLGRRSRAKVALDDIRATS